MRHSHQTRRVHIALHRMTVNIIMFLDPEGMYQADEDEIQFSIGEDRARAHAIAKTVGEHWCVGLLQPTLGTELVSIRAPNFVVFADRISRALGIK